MPQLNLLALVDDDLAPILTRYRALQAFLAVEGVEADQVAVFLDDNNQRLEAVLDHLAGVLHAS